MIMGFALLLCAISVPLAGGRLRAIAELELRASWALIAGILTQVVIVTLLPGGSPLVHKAAHLGSYALIAWFAWANRRVPFLWLIVTGGAMNFIAIAANGGVMPASRSAIEKAGVVLPPGEFSNSAPVDGAHLQWLGDNLWIPRDWPLPVHNVFSVGDLVITLGVCLLLHAVCGSRLGRRLTGRRAATA